MQTRYTSDINIKGDKMKKLITTLLLGLTIITLSACNMSVDKTKPTLQSGLKSALTTKANVEMSIVPSGDKQITIDGKTTTIPAGTFDAVRTYIDTNNKIQQSLIDIVGSQITDENIATIIYYAQKMHIEPEKLLDILK